MTIRAASKAARNTDKTQEPRLAMGWPGLLAPKNGYLAWLARYFVGVTPRRFLKVVQKPHSLVKPQL